MYSFILAVHNILRWVVLILAILVVVRSITGWYGKREWTDRDRMLGIFYTSSMNVQLLLNLLLYIFLSPLTTQAFQDFGTAMGIAVQRYFALEHPFYMLVAVVFAHLGSMLSKKASDPVVKHRQAAIWYGLSLLIILLGMPWMRPILPGF